MWSDRARHLTEGNHYQALEVFGGGGPPYHALLQIRNKGGELEVDGEHLMEGADALGELIDPKRPLLLTINTSQVLKKQLPTTDIADPRASVDKAFPNLDMDSFYYQVWHGQGPCLVSICKRSHVDQQLRMLSEMGIPPVQVALGISNIGVLEGIGSGPLRGSNFRADFADGRFVGFDKEPGTNDVAVPLDGITLRSPSLLGFAHVVAFLRGTAPATNLDKGNNALRDAWYNKKWFGIGLRFGSIFFLVLLSANFLLFNFYHEGNITMQVAMAHDRDKTAELGGLQERIAEKGERLERILGSKNSATSRLFDSLGASVPHGIQLGAVAYQPLPSPMREGEPIALAKGELHISGIASDRKALSVWTDRLEGMEWVDGMEIMGYAHLSRDSASFTLKITLDAIGPEQ